MGQMVRLGDFVDTADDNWENCLGALKKTKYHNDIEVNEFGYPTSTVKNFKEEMSSKKLQEMDWQKTLNILDEYHIEDNIELDDEGHVKSFEPNEASFKPDMNSLRESMQRLKENSGAAAKEEDRNAKERLEEEEEYDDEFNDDDYFSPPKPQPPTEEEEKQFYSQGLNDILKGMSLVDTGIDDFIR